MSTTHDLLLAWLDASEKRDFELAKEQQDDAAIDAASAAVTAARKAYRMAKDAERDPPPSLVERATLADYVKAAWHGHPLAGAAAELNEELGIKPVHKETRVPLALFMPETERLAFADTVINMTGANLASKNLQPILERIWPATLMPKVGIRTPTVNTGTLDVRWPTLAPDRVGVVAPNTARDTTDYALQPDSIRVSRLTGAMSVTQESLMTVPGLRDAMTRELQAALPDRIDREVFVGTGLQTLQPGIFNFIDVFDLLTADDDTEMTYDEVRVLGSKYLDQLWFRRGESDQRVVMGIDTGKFLNTVVKTNVAGDGYDVLKSAMRLVEGAAGQTPAKTPADSNAGAKQKALLLGQRGIERIFAPVWDSVGLQTDETGDNMRHGRMVFQVDFYMGLGYADYSGTAGTDREIAGIQGLEFVISDKTT